MTITSLDNYLAANKQRFWYTKASRTTTVAGWYSLFDLAGTPSAGTLAGSNNTAGVVPDDTVAGYPPINSFNSGTTGILSAVEYSGTIAGRIAIYDRVFLAGAYGFGDNVTLASQPSYTSRIPNADYKNLEIWVEQVTAATGNQAVSVGYTNQDSTTGRTTGAVGIGAAPIIARCWQLPLQAGDSGVTKIDTITGSVATAGTFNVMVLRPLWQGRVKLAYEGDTHDILRTGIPQVFDPCAFYVMVCPDATGAGVNSLTLTVANG